MADAEIQMRDGERRPIYGSAKIDEGILTIIGVPAASFYTAAGTPVTGMQNLTATASPPGAQVTADYSLDLVTTPLPLGDYLGQIIFSAIGSLDARTRRYISLTSIEIASKLGTAAAPAPPPSATDYQGLIVLELGQSGVEGFESTVGLLWRVYADKALIAPRLQYLYAKRGAVDVLLGPELQDRDWTDNQAGEKKSQVVANLCGIRKETETEILVIEARARANRGGSVGQIITVTPLDNSPVTPPAWPDIPDPNARAYRGDPIAPLRRWQR